MITLKAINLNQRLCHDKKKGMVKISVPSVRNSVILII